MDFVAWHDRDGVNHEQQTNQYFALGYRFVTLSIYNTVDSPLYAAVMVKRANIVAQREFQAMNAVELQQTIDSVAKDGFGATILCATGTSENPLYAAVFEPMSNLPLVRFGLMQNLFNEANLLERPAGILVWAAVYGDAGDERYAGIWATNTAKTRWNADGMAETVAQMQERFDAQVASWSRLKFVTQSQGQRYLTMYTDDQIGPMWTQAGLSSAQYQQLFNQYTGQGFFPLVVQASGAGASATFSVIFTRQEEIVARVWATPTGSPAVPAIDTAMQTLMETYGVRAASLAVTKGTKLVLARAYTLAEPGYPITQPYTYFRIASCSKTLTALAIHRLISQGRISLEKTMQSILNIETPAGLQIADPLVGTITVQNLLEMNSGLTPEFTAVGPTAVQAWNAGHPGQPAVHLPGTDDQYASYVTSLGTLAPPTTPGATYYSNFGYFMLGQILRHAEGADYFTALSNLVLHPMQINTTNNGAVGIRLARSLAGAQLPNEARYHSTDLSLRQSGMSDDRPLVGQDYGDEPLEIGGPAGGISACPAAYARMIALFSDQATPSPIPELPYGVLENVLTMAKNSFRGHGFDVVDQVNGAYRVQKGGSLETSQDGMSFTVGDVGFMVCWNTEGVGGDWYPYFPEVVSAAQTQDWGSTDLFPTFGMSSY